MTVEEIRSGLLHGRYKYGEGCLNEPMRIFSDIGERSMFCEARQTELISFMLILLWQE